MEKRASRHFLWQGAAVLCFATMLERPTARDRRRHADRQRRYRRRQQDGEAVLALTVDLHLLLEFLIETGRLAERAALDRGQIERAASQALRDLADCWREKNP